MLRRLLLLWWTLLSHYKKHPAQLIFLLIGLSLGVAMLLATLIVSAVAKDSFLSAQQSLGFQASAIILPVQGRQSFPEDVYIKLRLAGVTDVIPVVEGRIKTSQGQYLTLQGIDAFSLLHQSSDSQTVTRNNPWNKAGSALELSENKTAQLMLEFSFSPYSALFSESYGKVHHLSDGMTVSLSNGEVLPPLRQVNDDAGLGYYLLCDVRCAQQYLNYKARLTSILVTSLNDSSLDTVLNLLGPEARLVFPDTTVNSSAFSDAFLLNLVAIGYLAFLVGIFIAFNAVRFSVLQRATLIRQLRLVGATAHEVFIALMFELLGWAVVTSFIGCILGWSLASLILPSVGYTLKQLFFSNNILLISEIYSWWGLALVISIGATIIATLYPFWKLSQQKPLESERIQNQSSQRLNLAIVVLITGGIMTLLPPSQTLGLLITACLFIGGALLIPTFIGLFYQLFSQVPSLENFPRWHWLVNDGKYYSNRHSIAMMALTVAIAASISITIMIGSFRVTFSNYLEQSLAESLYFRLNETQVTDIETFLGTRGDVSLTYRFYLFDIGIENQSGFVRGMSDHRLRHDSVPLEQQAADVWQRFHKREGVLINQAAALAFKLNTGDSINVTINQKKLGLDVLGVYYSYGSLKPAIVIDDQWLLAIQPDLVSTRLGVFAAPDTDIDPLLENLIQRFNLQSHNYIKPNQLKLMAFTLFEQTFKATSLLSLVILLIAAIGVYSANFIGQKDRVGQLTLLRIIGLNSRELFFLSWLQVLINSLIVCLVTLPLGILIAWTSVNLVLRYSFGWYFPLYIEPLPLLSILVGSILITLLAVVAPLYQSSKKTVINSLATDI